LKGNTKKLAVFVVIAAMAMFIAATMASADDNKWKAFHGKYAATSMGSCLWTPKGFYPNLIAVDPTTGSSNSHTSQTIWTFYPDGTGTVQGRQVGLTDVLIYYASGSSSEISWQFTYNITHDGTITTDLIPGTYEGTHLQGPSKDLTFTMDKMSDSGMVSQDHKTITLGSVTADVVKLTYSSGTVYYGICFFGRVLSRVDE
jgi:hypothetical protein